MKSSIINIKQAILHNSLVATVPCTVMNCNILKLLLKEGLITHYKRVYKHKKAYYRVFLRYYGSYNTIKDIKNLYKSRRVLTNNSKETFHNKQSLLMSSSNGFILKTNAKNYGIGGKAFFFINC